MTTKRPKSPAYRSSFLLNDESLVACALGSGLLLRGEKGLLASVDTPSSMDCLAGVTNRLLAESPFPLVARDAVLSLVKHSCPTDWLHFIIDDQFREHRIHQVRVALIANWLLANVINESGADCGDPRSLRAEIWAACVCHDHGYALARLAEVVPALVARGLFGSDSEREERFVHLCQCYRGLFSESLMRSFLGLLEPNQGDEIAGPHHLQRFLGDPDRVCLPRVVLNGLLRDAPFGHGVWSAINLVKRLDEDGLPWGFLTDHETEALCNLVEAVASHHAARLSTCNRVLGILVLADELQEWGRVTRGKAEQMVEIDCKVEVRALGHNEMSITFLYSADDLRKVKWSVDGFRDEKIPNIRRLRGFPGLPHCRVKVRSY